jgi:hypothetical protein
MSCATKYAWKHRDAEHGPNWRGGRIRNGRNGGYWYLYRPDHPFSTKEGYVAEHRLVMEEHLGRYLTTEEQVHHISGDREDNSLSNLQLLSATEHSRLHNTGRVLSEESRRKISESLKARAAQAHPRN